ncbi:MAG: TIGR03557 family F420-dependent LLM class oxidoreductase [Chloroflexi bacterium]|nr:TIGR03557 family F420-dependent LLM class oxidoreductase [Chloroflexota bacterium]
MVQIGYSLSSEEHAPNDLVRYARLAEEAGFPYALISDHYHPWVPQQGHSPFVWSVIGGIAQATERLHLGTGVTCPTMRIHPAIIAQAAATAAAMMPGRFFLGVGSGERLNEHILGFHWPSPPVRLEMLEEAIGIIRLLWEGGTKSHSGFYFDVEEACIFTLPEQLPPIMIAASGPKSAEVAGRVGDGLITTSPNAKLIEKFEAAGGKSKPKYGQVTVCWAPDEAQARKTAHRWWPNAGLKGPLGTELAPPEHFKAAVAMVTEEQIATEIVCGPDPRQHVDKIQKYVDAGFDYVYVHQVGPDQEGFMRFYQREVLPQFHQAAGQVRRAA